MSNKQLLIEGETDRNFFAACCRKAGFAEGEIRIAPPNDFDPALGRGKDNALKLLPDLLRRVTVGEIARLGLVVDADYASTNNGFAKTLEKAQSVLAEFGYEPDERFQGLIFKHPDDLPNFGLWIMPDNRNDGMVEDFVKNSVAADELEWFGLAQKTVAELPQPTKFDKSIHASKAEVATWMAWQKKPGQSLAGVVGNQLIDFNTGLPKQFLDWLRQVYQ